VDSLITPENAFALLQLTAFDELRKDNEGGMVSFSGAERDEIEELLKNMLSEYRSKESFRRTVLESYMNILLVKILRKTNAGPQSVEQSGAWQKIADYIDRNLGEELTLSALAQKCFYNPSYFSRVFKQKFGSSPTEYIRSIRVRRAMDMLRAGDGTVEEVAEAVGFSDKSSFYHAFSKISGMTPAEYRANSKKKQP
jgi:AraC-like DNA-binding protein